MHNPSRLFIALSAFFALTGVFTGALGAHALAETLSAREMTNVWQTAALYHLVHALALFSLGIWTSSTGNSRGKMIAAGLWCLGILCFSGSLYALALGGPKILGPVTPLGGLLFISGWLSVMITAWKQPGTN